jgi:hypothetical protein
MGMVLKSVACVALVPKTADETRITIVFKSFGSKKINELVATNNRLRILLAWLQVVLGRMWPAGRRFYYAYLDEGVRAYRDKFVYLM